MERLVNIGGSLGVMQGRLSKQSARGYQTFPWGSWQIEFDLAATRHLEHIEWVLDSWRLEENPLLRAPEVVAKQVTSSGVGVLTVCADYLMDSPLDAGDKNSWIMLQGLVEAMQSVGVRWLVLPCVDQASLLREDSLSRFIRAIDSLESVIAGTGVRVSIESDLEPARLRQILNYLNPDVFGINYDIGNSAALGYQSEEEFHEYGSRISVVHVKDRVFMGSSVPLGEGAANIAGVIARLQSLQFRGPVTIQAYRDSEGIEIFDRQLAWLIRQVGVVN